MLRDPSLEPEFGWLLDNRELDDPSRHPFGEPQGAWVVDAGEGLAGFASLLRFAAASGTWRLLRVAVRGPHRRRGLGRALARQALEGPHATGDAALKISHWEPSDAGEPFARALGFEHERFFWTMERPGRVAPEVAWPAGIEARAFDGGDAAFQDWCDSYNRAFASNEMSIDATVEQCRALAAEPHFDRSGMILTYRAGRCVGFCRLGVHADHGDLDVLGVVPEERGIGLGRALVRWGAAWLIGRNAPSVRLTVDGENDRALALYRSEGFEIVRTRRIWRKPAHARG